MVTFLALRDLPKQSPGTDAKADTARQAEVQILNRLTGRVRDLRMTLPGGTVVSDRWRDGVVPRLSARDARDGSRLLSADSAWLGALQRRGLGPQDVSVSMMGPGIPPPDWGEPGHRYGRYLASARSERGFVSPPVEGIIGVVDLTQQRVVTVIDAEPDPPPLDRGQVPIFPRRIEPRGSFPSPIRGRGYQVQGSSVSWAGWEFRLTMDPREGLVLHDVAFGATPGGPARSILARASLAEMLVPYGDPSEAWRFRSIFDAGEYGIGRNAATLIPGEDLPRDAERFDVVLADDTGAPRTLPGVIGLHERDGGLRWRHGDRARRSRELVVRSATTVGNYDYGFSWVFSEDGVLAMEIDLTGMMLVKGVTTGDPRFGSRVGPNLSAIHHQHFFNFRLDFDIAGLGNQVREVEAVALPPDTATNPWGTGFVRRTTLLVREQDAIRDPGPRNSRGWVVENPALRDSLSGAPGYVIVPGPLPALQAAPASPITTRGAFATHALWVTRWKPEERYAAGEFPGQDPGGAGLPAFTADNEVIEDTDIVVWYTTGITHFPRPEEWPLMPVSRIRFELRPTHFLTGGDHP